VKNEVKGHWHCEEIVQNAMVREFIRRCDTVGNIHEVIVDPCGRRYHKESTASYLITKFIK